MADQPIKLIFTSLGWFIAKIEELPGRDIGEPDCLLIDVCTWSYNLNWNPDENGGVEHEEAHGITEFNVIRFPGKSASPDNRMAISSSNIFTIMDLSPALLSEYLVAISD